MAVFNVRDFGAVGNGVADDQPAFRAAINAAQSVGGGLIYAPLGIYAMGRHETFASLYLDTDKPLVFQGDGLNGTVIRMLAGDYAGDFCLFAVEGDDVGFQNLTLDGNKSHIPIFDEQTHLIQVHDQRRLVCTNVEFREAHGDGIKAVGSGALLVEEMQIQGCTFRNNGRSGITFQRAVKDCRIQGNFFVGNSDQDIDFEPTGATAPSAILIQGNLIEHSTSAVAVTLSGISGTDRTTDVLFEGNIIRGGGLAAIDTRNIAIVDNRISCVGRRCLDLTRGHDNIIVEDNELTTENQSAIYMATTNQRQPVSVSIQNNAIKTTGNVTAVLLESCADVVVSGNRIVDASGANGTPSGLAGTGIQARGTAVGFPAKNHLIANNQVKGYKTGVSVAASINDGCEDIAVTGNIITVGRYGVVCSGVAGTGKNLSRITVGNHCGAGITPLTGLPGAVVLSTVQGSQAF